MENCFFENENCLIFYQLRQHIQLSENQNSTHILIASLVLCHDDDDVDDDDDESSIVSGLSMK